MNRPTHILVHNTAVSRFKSRNQFDAVKRYHIKRGWRDIAYHWFIEPSGKIKKGRDENQSGAHCYQQLMNYRSIGICLGGYFDIEKPTKAQLISLNRLILEIKSRHNIKSVDGHRKYAPKTCPGKNLPDQLFNPILPMTKDQKKTTQAATAILSVLWKGFSPEGKKIASEAAKKLRKLK